MKNFLLAALLTLLPAAAMAAGPVQTRTDADKYDAIMSAVSRREVITQAQHNWAGSYIAAQLELMEDPMEPRDLRRWVVEKTARLTWFCAPENSDKHGAWFAMARVHCAELKHKFGVDFASAEAADKIDENRDRLFAAYKAQRRQGYQAAQKTLGEYTNVTVEVELEKPAVVKPYN
ncbi:MAG: hypothetical protein ABIJ96_00915 [Elusimicrobiota bacterium]